MNPKEFETMVNLFRNASESFKRVNQPLPVVQTDKTQPQRSSTRQRGVMNKTETEFATILEMRKRSGEIARFEFEGITFRWGDMRYTPDFVVLRAQVECGLTVTGMPVLIEVKGGFIRDRDIVRFKGARAYWPEFEFEMHQKKSGIWTRIY